MIAGYQATHPFNLGAEQSSILQVKAQFISTPTGSDSITDAHDGGKSILASCCEVLTSATMVSPGATKLDMTAISNHLPILSAYNKIVLNEIVIVPIHYQSLDSEVNAALTASLASPTAPYMAYNMAQGRFSIAPSWLDNFFNPIIKVNGVSILENSGQSNNALFGKTNHKGANSFGYLLPYQDHIEKGWNEPITSVEVNAGAFQIVNVSGVDKYQRYPLYCEMDFVVYQ